MVLHVGGRNFDLEPTGREHMIIMVWAPHPYVDAFRVDIILFRQHLNDVVLTES